ncbi:MAG: hypothetical protein ABR888_01165 [Thermoplasmata archaeon]|jgi:hypothetical protein|nr:hypothetical protein [Thermoplasmata archaeon]
MSEPTSAAKRPTIALTSGSKVTVRSAGTENEAIVSTGTFRGLVSIGGDNALAIELDGSGGAEKGRVRLVPIPAILAVDILEAVKADEEKRSEPPQSPAYFG